MREYALEIRFNPALMTVCLNLNINDKVLSARYSLVYFDNASWKRFKSPDLTAWVIGKYGAKQAFK